MTKVDDSTLKTYFLNGKVPRYSHYVDLIDSKLVDPITLSERAAPDTPTIGNSVLYVDTNGLLVVKNDVGLILPAYQANIDLPPLTAHLASGTATIGPPSVGYQYCVLLPNSGVGVMDWSIALPKGWGGRTVSMYLTWSPSSTNTGNIYFGYNIRRVKGGLDLEGSTPSYSGVSNPVPPGVINRVVATGFYGISLSSVTEGEHLAVRIYRDSLNAADTFTGSVQVSGAKISLSY